MVDEAMATDGKEIHDDRIVIEDTSTHARDGDIMNLEALPTEEVTCEECTHAVKATTWSIATRVGSVSFFRCPFCGHTWHKYRR